MVTKIVRGLPGQGERIFPLYGNQTDTTTNLDRSGVPATEIGSLPVGIAQLPDGRVLVADAPGANQAVLNSVTPFGSERHIGGGVQAGGFGMADPVTDRDRRRRASGQLAHGLGDDGPATQAAVASPVALLVRPDGSFLIGDDAFGMIRRVTPDGTIGTIAGGGPFGYGAAAINAQVAVGQMTALSDGGTAIANGATVDEIAPSGTPRLLIALWPGHLRGSFSIGFVDRRWRQCSAGKSYASKRLAVFGQLHRGLGPLGLKFGPRSRRSRGWLPGGCGFDDLVQHPLGLGLHPLGQRVEHIGCLVNPAALLSRCREHVARGLAPAPAAPTIALVRRHPVTQSARAARSRRSPSRAGFPARRSASARVHL